MDKYIFESERLGFRNWKETDKTVFYDHINSNEEVMEYFPSTLSLQESNQLVDLLVKHFNDFNYTFYAVDELDTDRFLGFIGLKYSTFQSDFTPGTEVGWRLRKDAWGKGYATEGCIACLRHFFTNFNVDTVFSITATSNKRSENVMIKSGLKKLGEFDHPLVEDRSPLKRHVLYQITRTEFEEI